MTIIEQIMSPILGQYPCLKKKTLPEKDPSELHAEVTSQAVMLASHRQQLCMPICELVRSLRTPYELTHATDPAKSASGSSTTHATGGNPCLALLEV